MEEELRAVLDGRRRRDVDDGGRVCGGGHARGGAATAYDVDGPREIGLRGHAPSPRRARSDWRARTPSTASVISRPPPRRHQPQNSVGPFEAEPGGIRSTRGTKTFEGTKNDTEKKREIS